MSTPGSVDYKIQLLACRNPKWITIREDDGSPVVGEDGKNQRMIEVETKWSHLGDINQEWQLFGATSTDPMKHGVDLYNALINGDHGDIAAE